MTRVPPEPSHPERTAISRVCHVLLSLVSVNFFYNAPYAVVPETRKTLISLRASFLARFLLISRPVTATYAGRDFG